MNRLSLLPTAGRLVAILATIYCANAQTPPPRFCLSNVVFSDGGTASGCFRFDSATNTYSDIAITTTTGGVRTGASYTVVSPGGVVPSAAGVLYVTSTAPDLTGTPGFAIFFNPSLGVTVATATLTSGVEANCSNAVCAAPAAPVRITVSGAVFQVFELSQIHYASNLSFGESVINLTNSGASSTVAGSTVQTQNGEICANIYAYSPDEQLVSCCSCNVTPNALNSLSVKADLGTNTLTPIIPSALVVKILATPGGAACTAASAATATRNQLVNGLIAWGTTIHALPVTNGTPATTYGVTETQFSYGGLSDAELNRMTGLCAFIRANGSGYGICKSCKVGGLAAAVK